MHSHAAAGGSAKLSGPRSAATMVRDRSDVWRKRRARITLVRGCAPHWPRHPGRGLRPRPPSSRFRGFDRCEPCRLVDVRRTGVDSLTFSHRMGSVPLRRKWPNSRSRKRTAHHRPTRATHRSAQRQRQQSSKLRQVLARCRRPPTSRANQPSELPNRDACTSLQSSPAQVDWVSGWGLKSTYKPGLSQLGYRIFVSVTKKAFW
jgi:hypothetical protein